MSRAILILAGVAVILFVAVMLLDTLGRMRRDRVRWDPDEEGEWEEIEPGRWDDGALTPAEVSKREQARQVLQGRVFFDIDSVQRRGVRAGLFVIASILFLALALALPFIIGLLYR